MGSLDDDFSFVAASVERAARVQRAACRAVLSDQTQRGQSLALHLDLAYDAIERRVVDRRTVYASAPDDTVRRDAIVELQRLLWQVRKLQSNLSWLEAAQDPPLDLGTRYFVEDVARALVAKDAEVTVVATDFTSYATSSDPWEPLISNWGSGLPAGAAPVVVVFIPRREAHSGLLHPLIVHELAHAADSQHGIVDEVWRIAQARKRFAARFSKAVTAFSSAHSVSLQDANDHITQALRSWIAESFCDSVATHHLGPTYLYSFLSEVAPGGLDDPGPNHPPPRRRIRRMLIDLDRLGWTDVIRNADADLESWVRDLAGEAIPYTGHVEFLVWAIDELAVVVRKATERIVAGRIFCPNLDELAEVSELLSARIPPAQRHNRAPVARESIIVAAWHAALIAAGGGPTALATAPDAAELAELLPSALELGALVATWSNP